MTVSTQQSVSQSICLSAPLPSSYLLPYFSFIFHSHQSTIKSRKLRFQSKKSKVTFDHAISRENSLETKARKTVLNEECTLPQELQCARSFDKG